jgi:hypothetical protein
MDTTGQVFWIERDFFDDQPPPPLDCPIGKRLTDEEVRKIPSLDPKRDMVYTFNLREIEGI